MNLIYHISYNPFPAWRIYVILIIGFNFTRKVIQHIYSHIGFVKKILNLFIYTSKLELNSFRYNGGE